MKYYCLSCNKATEWNGSRPKFCSHCGKAYMDDSIASKAPITSSEPVKPKKTPSFTLSPRISPSTSQEQRYNNQLISVSDDSPENDSQVVPNIDKLDISLNVDNFRPNRETASQVFAQGARGEQVLKKGKSVNNDFTPRQKRKVSKKEEAVIKENFKNEFKKTLSKRPRNSQIESQEIE